MLAALLPVLGPLFDRLVCLIPDPAAAAKAKIDATNALIAALQAEDDRQADIDKIEAGNTSVFVSGWRPSVGWMCSAGVGYAFLVRPLISGIVAFWQPGFSLPEIDTGELMYLLAALLGMGGLRTIEKIKGVAAR